MIMYMDCTGHSSLQFYCWFGVELRKISVECSCQEFQVRLTLKKCVALSNYAEIYAPYTKIIILNFTGGLVVCFCALNCFSVTQRKVSEHKVTSFDRRHADSAAWVGFTGL